MALSQRQQHLLEQSPSGLDKIERKGSVVDTVVSTAKVCNSLVLEYCSLCTLYIDQQVQYELIMGGGLDNLLPSHNFEERESSHEENNYDNSITDSIRSAASANMFDEDSVVESVNRRYY